MKLKYIWGIFYLICRREGIYLFFFFMGLELIAEGAVVVEVDLAIAAAACLFVRLF